MRDSCFSSLGMRPVRELANVASSFSSDLEYPHTQARQRVDTVNVHRAATADTLSAAPPKCEGGVHLVLDPDKRVQHHGSGLVQVEGVGLHLGLARGLVGVPSVDVEGLLQRLGLERGLLDGSGLGGGSGRARGRGGLGDGGNGLALGVLDGGGHGAAEDLGREARRKAPRSETKGHGVWFGGVWEEWRVCCGGMGIRGDGRRAKLEYVGSSGVMDFAQPIR